MQTANRTTDGEATVRTTDQRAATTASAMDIAEREEIRIPVVEERLQVDVRQGEVGEIRLQKHVERYEGMLERPLVRDDVTIERVLVERLVDKPEEPHYEGDVWVIPVLEEVLVVQKRLRVKEELRIRRRQVTEHHRIREELRRVRVAIEGDVEHSDKRPIAQATVPGATSTTAAPATTGSTMGPATVGTATASAASTTPAAASTPARDTVPAAERR